MSRKINELSPREVLALAIHMECTNGKMLRHFAEYLHDRDELSSHQFMELAQEEDHHEEWLTEKYKRRFTGPIPEITELEVPEIVQAEKWDPSEEKLKKALLNKSVYQMALEIENRAKKFYEEAANLEIDKFLALLFRQLSGMEDEHVKWLEMKIGESQG